MADTNEQNENQRQIASHLKGFVISFMECHPCKGKDTSGEIVSHVMGMFHSLLRETIKETETGSQESVLD